MRLGYACAREDCCFNGRYVLSLHCWASPLLPLQGTLGSLEARRLDYDATRRRLVTAAARAATDEAQEVETGASGQQEALVVTGGPQLVQLQELAAATSGACVCHCLSVSGHWSCSTLGFGGLCFTALVAACQPGQFHVTVAVTTEVRVLRSPRRPCRLLLTSSALS